MKPDTKQIIRDVLLDVLMYATAVGAGLGLTLVMFPYFIHLASYLSN